MDKGTYVIILKIEKTLEIEKPRKIILTPGHYVYVGSAMRGLLSRLRRHLSKGKNPHWHIDQLTEKGEVVAFFAIVGEKLEEKLSKFLGEKLEVIKGFGSSDLKTKGNLFRVNDIKELLSDLGDFYVKTKEL